MEMHDYLNEIYIYLLVVFHLNLYLAHVHYELELGSLGENKILHLWMKYFNHTLINKRHNKDL